MSEQDDLPNVPSICSGTSHGYSVQARWNADDPKEVNGMLLGKKWKTVEFQEGHGGVPCRHRFDYGLQMAHLVTYQAAQALRWWFHANAAVSYDETCLHTRIVLHKIKYSCESVAEKVACEVNARHDIESFKTIEPSAPTSAGRVRE